MQRRLLAIIGQDIQCYFYLDSTMSVLASVIAIALGAALGANLRWALALALNALFPALPPGTLAANLLGAWLIGMAIAVFAALPETSGFWRLAVITGFLGALTTFSTFSAELFTLIQSSRFGWALAHIVLHVFGSLVMTGLGMGTIMLLRQLAGGVAR